MKDNDTLMDWLCRRLGCHNRNRGRRFIRLQIASIRFVGPQKGNMPENIGIDIPAGTIARVQFKPVDERQKAAKLDGPLTATVVTEPGSAEVAVGGTDGLTVDIKPPDAEGSLATVEVEGDNDLSPDAREVISTIITVRRLGDVPGKAVSLGGTPDTVTFPPADQFGQFPAQARR